MDFSIGSNVFVACQDRLRYTKGIVLTKDDKCVEILLENDIEILLSIEESINRIIDYKSITILNNEEIKKYSIKLMNVAKNLFEKKKYKESGHSYAVSSVFLRCLIKNEFEETLKPTFLVGSRVKVFSKDDRSLYKLATISILNDDSKKNVYSVDVLYDGEEEEEEDDVKLNRVILIKQMNKKKKSEEDDKEEEFEIDDDDAEEEESLLHKCILNSSRAAMKIGKFDTCLLLLNDALVLKGEHSPSYYLKGRVLLHLKRLEEAKDSLMLANKYKPKNKQIYLALNHLKKALAAQKKEDKKLFKEMMNYLNEVVSENSGDIFKEGKEEES